MKDSVRIFLQVLGLIVVIAFGVLFVGVVSMITLRSIQDAQCYFWPKSNECFKILADRG